MVSFGSAPGIDGATLHSDQRVGREVVSAMEERAVFIACPEANATFVSRARNVDKMMLRLKTYCPQGVELVAAIEASRGAVAKVHSSLKPRLLRPNAMWFTGIIEAEEACELVADGEVKADDPAGPEFQAWKLRVSTLVDRVGSLEDVEEARAAWSEAHQLLDTMSSRLSNDLQRDAHARLESDLEAAAASRHP